MKKYLFLLISLLLLNTNSFADEVNPEGDDAWKSLTVTIKQLDLKKLPTSNWLEAEIRILFGGRSVTVNTKEIESGKDFVKKITIPKADSGQYTVSYGPIYPDSIRLRSTILSGSVEAGTKNIEGRLKRIDINHMKVTRDDGTTYVTTKGQAKVNYFDGANYRAMSQMATGLGIDVPVGFKYNVQVSAETEDGMDGYKADLDFTKL